MLEQLLIVLPTVLAIISLMMFNRSTRWFCYTLVSLSLISELIPAQVNLVAVAAVGTVLGALIVVDLIQNLHLHKPHLLRK